MSPAAIAERRRAVASRRPRAGRHGPPGGERDELSLFAAAPGPTCDDQLADLWDALLDERAGACPFCGGRMVPRLSSGAGVVGGRCADCRAEID